LSVAAIGAFAVTAAVLALTLRPKNSEIALLLTVAAAVTLLLSVLGSASAVIETVRQIVAVSGVSTGYLAIMLKVIGICLLTEFAANTCRDAGSTALAANVTLTGKLLVTAAALPLYADILNLVTALLSH
jgi:stage III sporulation protein AD